MLKITVDIVFYAIVFGDNNPYNNYTKALDLGNFERETKCAE